MTVVNPTGLTSGIQNLLVKIGAGGDTLAATDISNVVGDVTRFAGKVDVGNFDTQAGLDVGSGGSLYQDNSTPPVTVVKAFKYDASAASGSRFSEIADMNVSETWLGDVGDRMYIGLPKPFWGARFEIGAAMSSETMILKYYDGGSLTAAPYMVIDKDTSNSLGKVFLQGAVGEKEYITIPEFVGLDWTKADNILDTLPNTGTDIFWIAIENPALLVTPPQTDEIRVRMSDNDSVTGTGAPIYWGQTRPDKDVVVPLDSVIKISTFPKIQEEDITSTIKLPMYQFRNANVDTVELPFHLPEGIETGNSLDVSIDYKTDDAGEIDFDVGFYFVAQGTAIDNTQTDTGTFSRSVTASAIETWQNDVSITNGNRIDISTLFAGDKIIFAISRDGVTDANSGDVHIINFIIHYRIFQLGEYNALLT